MKKADVLTTTDDKFAWNEAVMENRGKRICFVCTGNTCRSPMAAAVLNHFGKEKGYTASSAGISVFSPSGISANAAEALRRRGILPGEGNRYDLHMSSQVSAEILEECDRLIGMTESHTMSLIFTYPQFASKISSLDKSISDPFGGDLNVYLNCLDEIIDAVKAMFSL